MKLLTKSYLGKLTKTMAKVEFSQDKLTVEPLADGKGELNFPVPFSCYKFINVNLSAKKTGSEDGLAKIGVSSTLTPSLMLLFAAIPIIADFMPSKLSEH